MKLLSGLDASFLHLETPEMPMHVGGLSLFDLPPGYDGDFYEDVKRHIASRMHLATVFTKKLALMPFEMANPVWVDDDDIDIDYHVRQIVLPKPGTMAQLEAYVGRLHSSLLDRSRPLWECYVFSGLKSGQAGFYSKIHHAALDGQGGAVLAAAIFDIGPKPRKVEPPVPHERAPYVPPVKTMLKAAVVNSVVQTWNLVKSLPAAAKVIGGMLIPRRDEDGRLQLGLPNLSIGPRTPLNVAITNQRVFNTVTIALEEAKVVGKAFGGSLNDAVLAICSGALRRWLQVAGALPEKSLIVAMPVSLRAEGNTELNNQVSLALVNLATDQPDPQSRIRALTKATRKLKITLSNLKSLLPTDFPGIGVPWLMSGLVSLYGRTRLADRLPPFANVAISNVPGPKIALYMAGARMTTSFPVSIVTHGLALNITVQSYNGALDFGLIACRRAMPEIGKFGQMLVDEHAALLSAAIEQSAAAARSSEAESTPAPSRRPRLKKRPA